MSIVYLQKDISTVERGVVAQGVNTQAVMGSGVAKVLRYKYPTIFNPYAVMCSAYKTNPANLLGQVCFVDVGLEVIPNTELIIANCFTQEFYGRDGKAYADAEAVKTSLDTAMGLAAGMALPLFMPKIGCGLGGLSWESEVEPVVQKLADKYGMVVHVCTL